MKLVELSQPLIDYIVDIYRVAQNDGKLEMVSVRRKINNYFDIMHESTLDNSEMAGELDKIKLPLIFFIDFMIKEGPFKFKSSWEELGREYNELSGDEKFFDILNDNLNDPSSLATQRLQVFYQCMGAGFTGCYSHNLEYIEKKMKVCALRIGLDSNATLQEKVSRNCYENILADKKFKDPTKKTRKIFFIILFLFLLTLLFNYLSFYRLIKPFEKVLEISLVSALPAEQKQDFMSAVKRYLPSIVKHGESDKEKKEKKDKKAGKESPKPAKQTQKKKLIKK